MSKRCPIILVLACFIFSYADKRPAYSLDLANPAFSNLEKMSKSKPTYSYRGLGLEASCATVVDSPEQIFLCATPASRYNMFSQSYMVIYLDQKLMIVATAGSKLACKDSPEMTIFYTNQTPINRFNWSQGVSGNLFSAQNDKFIRKISAGFNRVFGCSRNDSFSQVQNITDPFFTRESKFHVLGYGGGLPFIDLQSFIMPWDDDTFGK
jgi:hypothetical protein